MVKIEPITAKPDKVELAVRLEKVRELMEKQRLDYYVSFSPTNIYYLTNFANVVHERPFILIIPKKGPMKMVCPLLESTHVRARARCELDYIIYYEFPAPEGRNWYDVYRPLFKDDDLIGVESAMPAGVLKETHGTAIITNIIEDVRMIKSDYEIGRSVHACHVVDEGMKKVLELTRTGALLVTIYGAVVQAMMGKTLLEVPDVNLIACKFQGAVWPPSISHDPHIIPTPFMPMERGGPSCSIVSAIVDGYGVEIERTLFLGYVPEHAKKPFEVMMEGRELAFKLARPGVVLEDIDRQVRQVFIDAGYADNIIHRTGHGFGITGHEDPFVALGDKRKLLPGMIISVEPGIYFKGKGGYRHSDTVLITEDGNLKLTHAPENIEELTFIE
jgi:Xaa-Pro dipeptidase